MKKDIIIIHGCEGEKNPVALVSCEAPSRRYIDMVMFYIQTVANEVNIHFSLSPLEMKDILVKFYGFRDDGIMKIDVLKKICEDDGDDIFNVGSITLKEKRYDIIELSGNWGCNVDIYDIINSSKILYREGLKEHIEEITKDFKIF